VGREATLAHRVNPVAQGSRRRRLLTLALLTVAALALRITFIDHSLLDPRQPITVDMLIYDIDQPVRADALQYLLYAVNLVRHGVFSRAAPSDDTPAPDAFRSPGYPLLLALFLLLGGNTGFYPLALHAQAVMGAAMVALTFLLGCRFLPQWAAWAAAGLVALSPHMVVMNGYLLTETLFGFLLLAALYLLARACECGDSTHLVAAAIAFGLTCLVNETALLLLPLLLLVFRQHLIGRQRAVLLIVFALFPGGWMLRNQTQLPPGAETGATRAIDTLSHGSYPGFIYKDPRYRYFPYKEDPAQPAYGASLQGFLPVFMQRFSERPWRYLRWYLIEKPVYLWSWSLLQGQDIYIYPLRASSLYRDSMVVRLSRDIMWVLHPLIQGIVIAGLLLFPLIIIRQGADAMPTALWVVLLYYTALYALFAPWPRYAIPLRPEFYLWALWLLAMTPHWLRQAQHAGRTGRVPGLGKKPG